MAFRVGRWDRWTSSFASNHLRKGVARKAALRSDPPPEHNLTLYDFEASPWCRLVREYATILDLTMTIRPCPRETLLFGEGSFSKQSSYRIEAMEWHHKKPQTNTTEDNLTFPLLVDRTREKNNDTTDGVVVLTESYEILDHLWKKYGASVLPTHATRPDQIANAPEKSFARRFFSLAGPSYVRPWPRCGLMLYPTKAASDATQLVLYQAEGCPESRLVREALCCLKISYASVPVAEGSSNRLPLAASKMPVLSLRRQEDPQAEEHIVGAEECLEYLNDAYFHTHNGHPTWFDPIPSPNLGRSDGAHLSVVTAALNALQKGKREFVPQRAFR